MSKIYIESIEKENELLKKKIEEFESIRGLFEKCERLVLADDTLETTKELRVMVVMKWSDYDKFQDFRHNRPIKDKY